MIVLGTLGGAALLAGPPVAVAEGVASSEAVAVAAAPATDSTTMPATTPAPETVASADDNADPKETPKKETKKSKKGSKKKKSKKSKKKPPPPVQFSGAFALRVVYDDNIIHYSEEDLDEFETGPTPGKYSITTAGDWIVRPRLDLTLKSRALTGKKLEFLARFSSWRYVENGVKNNESVYLRLKHPGFGKDNFQLAFYHAPEAYLRNFRDREAFMPRSTPLAYTNFSYTSTSLGLAYWKKITSKVSGKLELKRGWRYYNRPFMENDNWEWRIGGYLEWRFVKPLKIRGEYLYSNDEARGADAVGEDASNSNDGDGSYERDSFKLALTWYVPKSPLRLKQVAVSSQYQAYYFTSERPPDEDQYHVGRKDEMYRYEVTGSTRKVWKSASLEGGYRYTIRDSSAPFETGDGEGIDEDKDYTDNRFWVGVNYPF